MAAFRKYPLATVVRSRSTSCNQSLSSFCSHEAYGTGNPAFLRFRISLGTLCFRALAGNEHHGEAGQRRQRERRHAGTAVVAAEEVRLRRATAMRRRGTITEVLLEHRAADAPVMPAMFELPPLPLEAVEGREPALRVRHAITNTNYYVQVFAPHRYEPNGSGGRIRPEAHPLRRAIPKGSRDLHWVNISRLAGVPLTGLTRKILRRLHVMENPRMNVLE